MHFRLLWLLSVLCWLFSVWGEDCCRGFAVGGLARGTMGPSVVDLPLPAPFQISAQWVVDGPSAGGLMVVFVC